MDALSGSLLGGAALAGYFSPALTKPLAIRALARRARARRALVLTYDDGPGPDTTRQLIEVLGERGARATFFVSGQRAADAPEVVAALRESGHEVGSHGFEHVHAWRATPWRAAGDVARGIREVGRHSAPGALSAPFRPPFGKATLLTALAARRAGARLAWWTHDSGDSYPEVPTAFPGRDALLANGGVVLLHDLDRSPPRNDYVLRTTRELLEAAPRSGLTPMTFGGLFSSCDQNENLSPA